MGSGNAPYAGYMLPVTTDIINKYKKQIVDQLALNGDIVLTDTINDNDIFEMLYHLSMEQGNLTIDFIQNKHIKNKPTQVELYRYDAESGDRYDSLEDGVLYFWFSEKDLFITARSSLMVYLEANNITPLHEAWTVYG